MKKAILLFTAVCLLFSTQAQKVKEKDVIGQWQLVIDVEEELEEEAEEADSFLEEVIIKSVSGFVTGILEDIDIEFEFESDNDVRITIKAYGETERESAKWFINKRGYLEIEDWDNDDDNFNISTDDDEWRLIDGLLISDDNDDDERTVYMKRIDN
ncbi:MAG: hypothetical protein AB8B73_11800 [Ekhidna sp.]